jgi:hypothetical protein
LLCRQQVESERLVYVFAYQCIGKKPCNCKEKPIYRAMKTTSHIGAHMSIAGGLHLAFERSAAIGGTTLQIFAKSPR